ncbi:MAG: hypothetical protein IJH87_01850, partial [Atopobiaceae bacterium]|nr:hypothetical protein [Atopobiaceae bacterium]
MRRSTRIWTWVVVLLAAIALVFMPQVAAYADAGDPPAHSKSRSDNGDGTYKIELTVTGDSDAESTSDSHVNVLIVYD